MSTSSIERSTASWPEPKTNPENAAVFEAVAEGVLLIGRCEACGQAHYYPRRHCPHCLAPGAQWQPAAGTGSIYSYTIVASSPDKPRKVVALVELDEGVQVLTNIVDSDEQALRVGARVALVIGRAGTLKVPLFRILTGTSASDGQ